jgi:hypothetical protein
VWKLYVPDHMKNEILKTNHDEMGSKTLNRLKIVWVEVKKYIQDCEVCRTSKDTYPKNKPETGSRKISSLPLEIISLDFMGELPRSKKGNKFILVSYLTEILQSCQINLMNINLFQLYRYPTVFHQKQLALKMANCYYYLKSGDII